MITADQLACHLVGDYILQSDWMGIKKTQTWMPALVHGVFYSLPFLFLRPSINALLVIGLTHTLIDHTRIARHACWIKNFIAPKSDWPKPWIVCSKNGYDPSRPDWLTYWLMFIADNTMHIIINGLALYYL